MRHLLFFILVACTGCSGLAHLDEALRLKAYSDEKDAQNAYVQAHDERFEEMLRQSAQPGAFAGYVSRTDIVMVFGDPVLCRMDGALERCLYRRIVKPMESPKIYFYFNAQGGLVRWNRT